MKKAIMLHAVEAQESGWVAQVTRGLQMKRAGEAMVSKALRKRLDKVGEVQWLAECRDEWGWAERTAYRHLNPEGMEQARQEKASREPAESRQVDAPAPAKPSPTQQWEPDQITEALSTLSKASQASPAKRYLADLQRQSDQGIGIDATVKEAFVAIREWLDEVIGGLDAVVVSCATRAEHAMSPAAKEAIAYWEAIARETHEPGGVGTCTGVECPSAGPTHRPHATFACTCGTWYGAERGLRIHVARAKTDPAKHIAAWTAKAKHEPAAIAAEPELRSLAEARGLTLTRQADTFTLTHGGKMVSAGWCPSSTEGFIREYPVVKEIEVDEPGCPADADKRESGA